MKPIYKHIASPLAEKEPTLKIVGWEKNEENEITAFKVKSNDEVFESDMFDLLDAVMCLFGKPIRKTHRLSVAEDSKAENGILKIKFFPCLIEDGDYQNVHPKIKKGMKIKFLPSYTASLNYDDVPF